MDSAFPRLCATGRRARRIASTPRAPVRAPRTVNERILSHRAHPHGIRRAAFRTSLAETVKPFYRERAVRIFKPLRTHAAALDARSTAIPMHCAPGLSAALASRRDSARSGAYSHDGLSRSFEPAGDIRFKYRCRFPGTDFAHLSIDGDRQGEFDAIAFDRRESHDTYPV